MSLKIWEINGLSLEFDLGDVEASKRYEEAFEEMMKAVKSIPKDGKNSSRLEAQCKIIRRLFEHIFGQETADKIFEGTKMNALVYIEICNAFVDFASKQSEGLQKEISKYLPSNRQQRRAAKKK